jgi:nucleoside-diphosphate-sugar epimerase
VLRRLRRGRVILVDGGRGLANTVYVDDLVEAMLLAGLVPGVEGQAFLISGDEVVTWRELHACFERMVGAERTVSMSADEATRHWRRHRWELPSALPRVVAALRQPEVASALAPTREVALARWAGSQLPFALQAAIKRSLRARLERRRVESARGAGAGAAPARGGEELPIHPLDPLLVRFFAARTRVRTDRARRLLGWAPRVDLATGMARTEAWARWANLI